MLRIERELEKRSAIDPQNDFCKKFLVLKQRLLSLEYTFCNFPGGNDHGPSHINRVLEYLDKLIPDTLLGQLNAYEIFVLLTSALYHDLGLLQGRPEHAQKSGEFVDLDAHSYLMNDDDARYISAIVRCHSSKADIEQSLAQFREGEPVRGFSVRPRFLAALIRLADALDEDVRRADYLIEEKMKIPAESAIYWKSNQGIRGIEPKPNQETIEFNIKFSTEDLVKSYEFEGRPVSIFEGVIKKLDAINAERKNCMRFLQQALVYRSLTGAFCQSDTADARPFQFVFDSWNGEAQFFVSYPKYKTEKGEEAISGLTGANLRTEYLNRVANDFRYVDFKGIPVPGGVLKISVPDIFVEVSVKTLKKPQEVQPTEEDVSRLAGRPTSASLAGFAEPTASSKISKMLKKWKRLVILGDPGSGKTTLLRYLGFHCAENETVGFWLQDRPTPVYIGLREYASSESGGILPTVFDCIPQYFEAHEMGAYASFVSSELRAGRCIVFLDGLDEVPTGAVRRTVAKQVESFVRRYRGNRFIITSRIVGYSDAPLSTQFKHCRIQPFGKEEISFFIKRWCDATESDDSERERECSLLERAIFTNNRIAALATNPLLVTILARVHRTYRNLPERKTLLYSKCVEALLTTRDMNRNMPPVFVDERHANRVMGPIALWVHDKKKGGFLSRHELASYLSKLGNYALAGEDDAGELVRLIEERSGLLIQRGLDRFTFAHLTFQEYYAARELVSTAKYMDSLIKHIYDPRWLEVLTLVGGLLDEIGPAYVTSFVIRALELIKLPKKSIVVKDFKFGGYSLAGRRVLPPIELVMRCLNDKFQPDDVFYYKLEETLRQICEKGLFIFELCDTSNFDLDARWREYLTASIGKLVESGSPPVAESAWLLLGQMTMSGEQSLERDLYVAKNRPDVAAIIPWRLNRSILLQALQVTESQLREDAHRFLATLPPREKEYILKKLIMRPHYVTRELDRREVASLLDIQPRAVERIFRQARRKRQRRH